jgi:hypothetical protein
MKKIILATLLTLTAACGEKRTLSTPINDLTSAEALREMVIQDCKERLARLEQDLAPVELIPLAPICVDTSFSLRIQGLKSFLSEKSIERIYLTDLTETRIGFDIESVRSMRVSLGFAESVQEVAALWDQQFGDLKREIIRTPVLRITDLRIEGIVVSKTEDLKKVTRVVELLSKSEEFVRSIELMCAEKGEFPIFISFTKCEVAADGLYLNIKPRSVFGTSLGAVKNCLKKLQKE